MQLQQPLQKCDCVAQTLLLQTLEIPAAGEKFSSQMGITCVTWLFLCPSTEGLAQLLWLEKTRAWSWYKKQWKRQSDELQMESSKMPSKWQNGTGDESCHVSVPRIQCAVQLKISPAGLQAVSHREREGLFMGFWFSEEKHETVRNDRDMRVLDNGKQRMESFWNPRCSVTSQPNSYWSPGPVHFCWKNLAPGTPGTKWKPLNF